MASSTSIPVNPAILRWAREDAGFSLEEAAIRAKINEIKPRGQQTGMTPAQRLAFLETGELPVSPTQLSSLAKAYRRPEITFFLPAPPCKENLLADFRTVDSLPHTKDSPEFAALKRRIINLHRGLKDIAEAEEASPLPFVGSLPGSSSVPELVSAIKDILGPDPRETPRVRSEDDFFKELREQAQQAGIYVVLLGDLGSHHSAVSLEEFRGISIADPLAPLIIINPHDTLKARVFSLLHELCHILQGRTGISNKDEFAPIRHSRQQEYFCNAVAAEYLVPANEMRHEIISDLGADMTRLAKKYKVSELVISRRALDLGKISQDDYNMLARFYISNSRRRKESPSQKGGPNANQVAAFRLGKKLISSVLGAADSGYIGFSEASSLLGLPVSRFSKVIK